MPARLKLGPPLRLRPYRHHPRYTRNRLPAASYRSRHQVAAATSWAPPATGASVAALPRRHGRCPQTARSCVEGSAADSRGGSASPRCPGGSPPQPGAARRPASARGGGAARGRGPPGRPTRRLQKTQEGGGGGGESKVPASNMQTRSLIEKN